MKDVTLLIQGKITQESYNFFVETYPQYPIVFSTWSNHNLDLSYFPHNVTFIQQKLPTDSGKQNMNYQFTSTLNGIDNVKTKFVIKFRGDEFYSNVENIEKVIIQNPNKIHTSPIYFRHWSMMQFHISDHIISGLTSEVKFMFGAAKYAWDNKLITYEKDGKQEEWWEPEIMLTRAYLMAKYKEKFPNLDGRELMVKHFEILTLENLKPYRVICNLWKTFWDSNFIPHNNYSLSKIEQMLDDKPPYEQK